MTPPYVDPAERGGYDTDELDAIAAGETHAPYRDGLRVCVTSGYPMNRSGALQAEGIVYAPGGVNVWRCVLATWSGSDARAIVRAKCEAWIAADAKTRATFSRIERWGGGGANKIWRSHGVPA